MNVHPARPFAVASGILVAVAAWISVHVVSQELYSTETAHVSLIAASETMTTAWDFPRNPLTDSTLDDSPRSVLIRRGFNLFINTPENAARLSPNKLSCNNCHLNAGQKERAMPLVGIAAVYPEYNKRDGRVFSLEDRIVGCFRRSQCAIGKNSPTTESEEVMALAAYLRWLSEGIPEGTKLPWRGHNVIQPEHLIPVSKLNPKLGKFLFLEKCSNCHGKDGQGVQIGDKKAGPLWGPDSWNDGAGAARIYTLAGIIRYAMPYLDPGILSDEEAQQIAAFINSRKRPEYPWKDGDYRVEALPPDAVYYKR